MHAQQPLQVSVNQHFFWFKIQLRFSLVFHLIPQTLFIGPIIAHNKHDKYSPDPTVFLCDKHCFSHFCFQVFSFKFLCFRSENHKKNNIKIFQIKNLHFRFHIFVILKNITVSLLKVLFHPLIWWQFLYWNNFFNHFSRKKRKTKSKKIKLSFFCCCCRWKDSN